MMTILINGIQVLQHRLKKCVNFKRDDVEKLTTFYERILVKLSTSAVILNSYQTNTWKNTFFS